MSRCSRLVSAFAAVLLLAPSAELGAQTTGRLFGQLVDGQGAVLPGATVTVTGPALLGAQSQTTDTEGRFRFPSLPPGRYTVKAEMVGFKAAEQSNVDIGLDRTVTLTLTMHVGGLAESVEVTAASPVVDTTSTTIGVNAKAEIFNRLPIQRDIYSISRLAPGTTDDGVGPAVLGSTGAENQYIVEGLNTTGIERAEKGKQLNFDFVEEIEVKTGGLPAEYGRATGGVINVITKSGGNTFRGSLFGFNEGGALQSNENTADLRPATTTTVTDIDKKWDFGFEAGGFFVRDRLWYFAAYNHTFQKDRTEVIRRIVSPGTPGVGEEIFADINRDLFAGKITYKLSNSQTLTGSVNGDPGRREGNIFTIAGPASTWEGEREFGDVGGVLRYDGVFGGDFLIKGLFGQHRERDEFAGPGKSIARSIDSTVTPNANSGGFGPHQDSKFKRNVYKLDVAKFWGGHEIKGGVDWEDIDSEVNRFEGGAGQRVSRLRSSAATGSQIYYRHRFFIDDTVQGFDPNNPATFVIAVPLTVSPGTLNNSFYAQDSWKVASNLTVNAGIRWERQQVKDRFGESSIDIDDSWAPRIGVVWDATRNGRSKIFGSYGRFFESIPLDINIRSFGGESSCFCNNFDPNPANILPDPASPVRTSRLGLPVTPVDEALKGQYINEFLLGGEYEVRPNLSVGAKFSYRDLGRVIEDFLIIDSGGYFIANPASGLGRTMTFYDYSTVTAPKAERTNTSIELSARKKFSDNWQVLTSYVWSRLEGNYDGTFQNSTGQLDPNINSAFDYADFLVNAKGRLSNERVHQWKFDGSYEVASGALSGLNLGLSTRWLSGYPLNAYGHSFLYANWEYYLVPRGSAGRGPSDWEADIQVSYPLRLGGNKRMNLFMDIFNLFNRQEATQLDERYNLIEDGGCAGIPESACNHDNGLVTQPGTLTPVFTISDPRASATNPDYLEKGITFTAPRSIRLGVRFNW
jgi:outer membrane receptor for Fe3+-dicitrate